MLARSRSRGGQYEKLEKVLRGRNGKTSQIHPSKRKEEERYIAEIPRSGTRAPTFTNPRYNNIPRDLPSEVHDQVGRQPQEVY